MDEEFHSLEIGYEHVGDENSHVCQPLFVLKGLEDENAAFACEEIDDEKDE